MDKDYGISLAYFNVGHSSSIYDGEFFFKETLRRVANILRKSEGTGKNVGRNEKENVGARRHVEFRVRSILGGKQCRYQTQIYFDG